jgi:hypothetical protein
MLRHWPSEAHNRQQQRNENPVNPADDQSSRAYVLTYCIDCMVTSLTYITGSSRAHNSTPLHTQSVVTTVDIHPTAATG